jgi:putative FmdB family regulatory protein
MPIYEYVCAACGERVEVIHGIHGPGPETCAACGGQLRKAVSAPAIVFKGSGWAKKDARAASRPASGSGAKPGADESSGGGSDADSAGAPAEPAGSKAAPDAPKPSAPAPSSGD